MTGTRTRIETHVRAHPGVHFNELVRALDLAPGQVQYHLRRLTNAEVVTEESIYGRTHYYPPSFDPWERRALALVRRETARDVLAVLLESGPTDPATVAERVGIARGTLEWHAERLVDAGLVRKEYDERGRVTLVATRPKDTARLLRTVTPGLPQRLVDRFTRLVDDLLEESSTPPRR